jgi:hypothetical protein
LWKWCKPVKWSFSNYIFQTAFPCLTTGRASFRSFPAVSDLIIALDRMLTMGFGVLSSKLDSLSRFKTYSSKVINLTCMWLCKIDLHCCSFRGNLTNYLTSKSTSLQIIQYIFFLIITDQRNIIFWLFAHWECTNLLSTYTLFHWFSFKLLLYSYF